MTDVFSSLGVDELLTNHVASPTGEASQFAPLLRLSPVAICLSTLADGRIIDANDAFLRMFGYLWEEVVGRTSSELGMFADPNERDRAVRAVLAQPTGRAVEVTIATRAGTPRRVMLWPEILDVSDQQCLLTQILEIPTKHETSTEWQDDSATAALLRAVFDAAAEGIVVQDGHGRIVMANPSAERILGLSTAQMAGRTARDTLWRATLEDGTPLAAEDHPSAVTLRTGCPQTNVVMEVTIGDLAPVWVSVTTRPVQLPGRAHPNGVVASFFDISDRKHHEARLAHQASRDPLTGLLNRRAFMDRVDEELRQGNAVSVFFVDLDGFKYVNDTFGHSAGDQLLEEVGRRLSASLRQTDSAARFGGDEFTVLLVQTTAPQALVVGERILEALREPIALKSHSCQISASIGMTLAQTRRVDVQGLLAEADAALYRAKAMGKNRISLFTSPDVVRESHGPCPIGGVPTPTRRRR